MQPMPMVNFHLKHTIPHVTDHPTCDFRFNFPLQGQSGTCNSRSCLFCLHLFMLSISLKNSGSRHQLIHKMRVCPAGVRFPGLIHPGLIGTAPSHELLKIWNDRERKLVEDGEKAVTLGGVLHTRPLGMSQTAHPILMCCELCFGSQAKLYANTIFLS